MNWIRKTQLFSFKNIYILILLSYISLIYSTNFVFLFTTFNEFHQFLFIDRSSSMTSCRKFLSNRTVSARRASKQNYLNIIKECVCIDHDLLYTTFELRRFEWDMSFSNDFHAERKFFIENKMMQTTISSKKRLSNARFECRASHQKVSLQCDYVVCIQREDFMLIELQI